MYRVAIVLALLTMSACALLPNQQIRPEDKFQQGVSFLKSRQYDEAIGSFSAAVELNPQYSEAYLNRGLAWAGKGDLDQAISDYTQALESSPRDGQAYKNRGLAWAAKGEYDRAISD
jgi:tetratricopeptide (TPR) repeat protein